MRFEQNNASTTDEPFKLVFKGWAGVSTATTIIPISLTRPRGRGGLHYNSQLNFVAGDSSSKTKGRKGKRRACARVHSWVFVPHPTGVSTRLSSTGTADACIALPASDVPEFLSPSAPIFLTISFFGFYFIYFIIYREYILYLACEKRRQFQRR